MPDSTNRQLSSNPAGISKSDDLEAHQVALTIAQRSRALAVKTMTDDIDARSFAERHDLFADLTEAVQERAARVVGRAEASAVSPAQQFMAEKIVSAYGEVTRESLINRGRKILGQ